MLAFFVFFWGHRYRFFVWQHGFAAHQILESGGREYPHQADGLASGVLYTYPGVRRNEYYSSRVQIAFLVPQMNVSCSFFDEQNLILSQMFVGWYFVSWMHVFGHQNEVLRAVVLRADLQYKFARRKVSPYAALTFIFFQQEGSGSILGRGCRTGSC